jgi:hypothetical protein
MIIDFKIDRTVIYRYPEDNYTISQNNTVNLHIKKNGYTKSFIDAYYYPNLFVLINQIRVHYDIIGYNYDC